MNETAERFMRMAIAEARKGMREGNHPYGSVIVKDGTVLVRAHSTGALSHDVAAHADMSAARKLSKKAKRRDVKGCTVYATGEPCPNVLRRFSRDAYIGVVYRCQLSPLASTDEPRTKAPRQDNLQGDIQRIRIKGEGKRRNFEGRSLKDV